MSQVPSSQPPSPIEDMRDEAHEIIKKFIAKNPKTYDPRVSENLYSRLRPWHSATRAQLVVYPLFVNMGFDVDAHEIGVRFVGVDGDTLTATDLKGEKGILFYKHASDLHGPCTVDIQSAGPNLTFLLFYREKDLKKDLIAYFISGWTFPYPGGNYTIDASGRWLPWDEEDLQTNGANLLTQGDELAKN